MNKYISHLLCYFLGLLIGYVLWHNNTPAVQPSPTVIMHTDTMRVTVPVPRDTTIIRVIHRRIPVYLHDTITIHDTISLHDTTSLHVHDTTPFPLTLAPSISIPISQIRYADSAYTAYVSGYLPSLDSIFIYQQVATHAPTTPRRFQIGILTGYGLGLNSRSFQPFIGFGLSYRLR